MNSEMKADIISRIKDNAEETVKFLENAPVVMNPGELIGGFSSFGAGVAKMQAKTLGTVNAISQSDPLGVYKKSTWNMDDNFHYPMGFSYLKYGFAGVADRARERRLEGDLSEINECVLKAVEDVYSAADVFIGKHYPQLSKKPPETFLDAVRMLYISWRIRCVLSNACIGRIDQYLYPFYKKDIECGTITRPDALEIICAFFRKINECGSGDTLINVLVGGSDENGEDVTNELSYIMLEAAIETRMTEPHMNARIHSKTSPEFIKLISKLHLLGFGQCTVYNDDITIPALEKAGIPHKDAVNYTNDGCTEIVIDQGGGIYFERIDAVKCIELTLLNGREAALPGKPYCRYWTCNSEPVEWQTSDIIGFESGDIRNASSFEEVFDAFKRQYAFQTIEKCKAINKAVDEITASGVAPAFLNGSFESVLETGDDIVRGGLKHNTNMVFGGSIPSAADSLAAIKYAVFDKKVCTMETLIDAVSTNFDPAKYEGLRKILLSAPKFGNDDDYVDLIARDIAKLFTDICDDYAKKSGFLIWPALLGFMFIQESYFTGATPDGRRWKEPIGEHYSPVPGRAKKGPLTAISSICKGPLKEAFGVAPVHISLSRASVPMNDDGLNIINAVLMGAIRSGLPFVNIACYSKEDMEDARIHPELHQDLIVRVWGYCARFVDLSPEMQEHVMARAMA